MVRDVLNALIRVCGQVQPPTGNQPTVIPGSSNVGSGVVSLDPSSTVTGTYNALLVVTQAGPPGTAQGKLSLDNGGNVGDPNNQGNFSAPFTLPSGPAAYPVPLPAFSPGNLSPVLSGLVLNFSGSFSVGDTYEFQALPVISFLLGGDEVSSEDAIFPRVNVVPVDDDFTVAGPEDYAQGQDQSVQQRALLTDVATFECRCWGIDYDRTEILRDTVINGIQFAFQGTKHIRNGKWINDKSIAKTGNLYSLMWSVRKPVMKLQLDEITVNPPFSLNLTPQVVDSP